MAMTLKAGLIVVEYSLRDLRGADMNCMASFCEDLPKLAMGGQSLRFCAKN